jgi:hypothetical protein
MDFMCELDGFSGCGFGDLGPLVVSGMPSHIIVAAMKYNSGWIETNYVLELETKFMGDSI